MGARTNLCRRCVRHCSNMSDSESSSEEEEMDPRVGQLAEYIASGCSPEECAARLELLGAKDALVGGGLCFDEEFSLAYFLICATILKGNLMEKIKECAPLLKHWCESRANVEEAHEAFLIALEMVIVQEKPTWIKKYDDVLKQHWNYDVVPDEQIEAWQNEEKALHKYCGHAWHLKTAIAVREAGQRFVEWMLAGEDE